MHPDEGAPDSPRRRAASGGQRPRQQSLMGRLDSCAALPAPSSTRLLARDDAFHQSTGKLIVRPTNLPRQSSRTLRRQQAFFLVLGMRTWKLIALVIFAHVFSFVLFAPFFYLVSDEDICDLGVGSWMEAIFLSAETGLTIGYGIKSNDTSPGSVYWNGCYQGFVLLSVQASFMLIFEAILIGIVYQRISRVNVRARRTPPRSLSLAPLPAGGDV